MMKKIYLGFVVLLTAMMLVFGLTACKIVPEHVHSYSATVVEPTCTEGGYTLHKCSCGKDEYRDNETEATGHDFVNGTCTVCGEAETTSSDTYTIRFVIDDKVVEEQSVKSGAKFKKPSCSILKEGYTFDGWMLADGTKVNWTASTGREVNANMTITAHYTIKTYNVKFYVNGSVVGDVQKVEHGKEFTLTDVKDVVTKGYLEIVGYKLNNSEQTYTEETLDKTVKANTKVEILVGLRSGGDIKLNGFKDEFFYLENYEKGDEAEVKILFENGDEYTVDENEYEITVPNDFGKEMKEYKIGVKLTIAEDLESEYTVNVKANRERFKVLIIGNSFSDDTIAYAYQVAKSAGIQDVEVADLYYGGCTIERHIGFAENNSASYIFRYFDKDNLTHNVDSVAYDKVTMEYGITYKPWDIIVFQQGSSASGLPDSYAKLPQLMAYVKARATNKNVRFAFNMTWAYAQNSANGAFGNYGKDQQRMYNAILTAVQTKVITNDDIVAVIPNGTAVQNARTSFIGDNLTRDSSDHLTHDTGRYIAAMTFITRLTGLTTDDVTFVPTGLASAYITAAKESVKNALNKPYEVTKSQYTDETQALIGNRRPTSITFTQGWYDSTQSNGYELLTTSNYLKTFKATQKFTRETLPVGSLIYVASGWRYRPEGWKDKEKVSPRQNNVSTQWVEVTEEWWGVYTERAFNLSTSSGGDISGKTQADMEKIFIIYVPITND